MKFACLLLFLSSLTAIVVTDPLVARASQSGVSRGIKFGALPTTSIGMGVTLFPALGTASPAAIDVNNDGKLDMVGLFTNIQLKSEVVVQLGNGDGTFQSPITTQLILTDGRAMVQLWLGMGDGSFSQGGDFAQTTQRSTAVAGFAVADFNGDGRIDIASVDQLGPNFTLLLQGNSIVTPTVLSFGTVKIGTSKSLQTKVSNNGSTTFNITSIKVVGNTTDYHIKPTLAVAFSGLALVVLLR